MTIRYNKGAADTVEIASMSKIITALVMRDWVPDVDLDNTVSVNSYDVSAGGSSASLMNGDVISYRHIAYGLMVASGNDAARCISRHVGGIIIANGGPGSSTDPAERFKEAMEDKCASLGYSGYNLNGPAGFPETNSMRPVDVADAILQCSADPFLMDAMSAPVCAIVITGANARTYTLSRAFNPAGPIPFDEFLAAKTGLTDTAGYCVSFLWQAPDGTLRSTVTAGADTADERYADVRALLDHEIGRSAPSAVPYQYQVFTEGGYFHVPDGVTEADALLVAGGGGGGGMLNNDAGGGGGGGEVRVVLGISVTPLDSIPVTVGAGGLGGSATGAGSVGGDGGDSSFGGETAKGGGGGGAAASSGVNNGRDGGSGGGGSASTASAGAGAGGSSTATGLGNDGGGGFASDTTPNRRGGGGGGARGAGATATATTAPGHGGEGVSLAVLGWAGAIARGAPRFVGAGGGGATGNSATVAGRGLGGSGVGGNGGYGTGSNGRGSDALPNTGSGGGGSTAGQVGGGGGSGLVVVRWKA